MVSAQVGEVLLRYGANLGLSNVGIANELCHCAANSEIEHIRWEP
jgi:hypothetical protein